MLSLYWNHIILSMWGFTKYRDVIVIDPYIMDSNLYEISQPKHCCTFLKTKLGIMQMYYNVIKQLCKWKIFLKDKMLLSLQ